MLVLLAPACGDDAKPLPPEEAVDELFETCTQRKREAFNPNQPAFRSDVLRWSCADTAGVSGVDRGQEYCEYFAVVRLGTKGGARAVTQPLVLGSVYPIINRAKETGSDRDLKPHLRDREYGATPHGLSLTAEQRSWLEEDPTRQVGQCVFSSWNQDATATLACDLDPTLPCPDATGLDVSKQFFQMKFETNSNEAAQALLEDCIYGGNQALIPDNAVVVPEGTGQPAAEGQPPVFEEVPDPRTDPDPFMRGCFLNAGFNQTEHRKSDTVLCTAAMRMAECGCESSTPTSLMEMLSPKTYRGFPLGSWARADALPPGCEYLDIHDDSQTLVACALSAADVLRGTNDVKQICREKYGPDVVVHVPFPAGSIRCDKAKGNPAHNSDCPARPWVVEANW